MQVSGRERLAEAAVALWVAPQAAVRPRVDVQTVEVVRAVRM